MSRQTFAEKTKLETRLRAAAAAPTVAAMVAAAPATAYVVHNAATALEG